MHVLRTFLGHKNVCLGASVRRPGFTLTTNVINGFSDLILELYGPEAGMPARMAPGLATLPLGVPVTIAAEVAIRTYSRRLRAASRRNFREFHTSPTLGE